MSFIFAQAFGHLICAEYEATLKSISVTHAPDITEDTDKKTRGENLRSKKQSKCLGGENIIMAHVLDEWNYISPEEYKAAAANGINEKLLNNRIRNSGWDHQRAITQPLAPRGRRGDIAPEEYEQAAKNGINAKVLRNRIHKLGWNHEEAVTTPVLDRHECGRKGSTVRYEKRGRSFHDIWAERAKPNGIRYGTFMYRLKHGWLIEQAVSVLPNNQSKHS